MNLKKQISYKYLAIFWDPENRSLFNGEFPIIINQVISIFFVVYELAGRGTEAYFKYSGGR